MAFNDRDEVLKLSPHIILAMLRGEECEADSEKIERVVNENADFFDSVRLASLFQKTRVYEGNWGIHVKRLQILKRVCTDICTVEEDELIQMAGKYSSVLKTLCAGGRVLPESAQELLMVYQAMVGFVEKEYAGF